MLGVPITRGLVVGTLSVTLVLIGGSVLNTYNANQQILAEQAAAEEVAAEKAAAEKAEVEKVAAEKAEVEKVAAEKAEVEKVAAEKAEVDLLAAEKAEAERIAGEQAAAEKAAAEKAAAEKASPAKTAADMLTAWAVANKIGLALPMTNPHENTVGHCGDVGCDQWITTNNFTIVHWTDAAEQAKWVANFSNAASAGAFTIHFADRPSAEVMAGYVAEFTKVVTGAGAGASELDINTAEAAYDLTTDAGLCAADSPMTDTELNDAIAPQLGFSPDRRSRTFEQDEALRAYKNAAFRRACPYRAS